MVYAIAHKLGMTVGELSERMTAQEFGGWVAYFSLQDSERRKAASGGGGLADLFEVE